MYIICMHISFSQKTHYQPLHPVQQRRSNWAGRTDGPAAVMDLSSTRRPKAFMNLGSAGGSPWKALTSEYSTWNNG